MTRKRKTLLALVIVAVGFCLVMWLMLPPAEPRYKGKPLSAWAQQYGTNKWGGDQQAAKEAETALRAIGTNAIPFLLERMRAHDTDLKKRLRKIVPRNWHDRLRLADVTDAGRRTGAYGLAALGTNAPSAVPALIDIAAHHPDASGRYIAVFALRTLGPASEPAIPFLIQCLTNSQAIIRDDAAMGLGEIGRQPEVCVPALIRYLEFAKTTSPQTFELMDTIGALWKFGTNAQAATPVLLPLLNHPDQNVRQSVINFLPEIDPEAATKAGLITPK